MIVTSSQTPITSGSPIKTTANSAVGSMDEAQSRFMKLLIAQMKNQDPLTPMDNSQLTSQMAQLNMVSGINQLNSTMSSMAGTLQSDQTTKVAGLIGRSVLAPGNGLQLVNGQAQFGVELKQPTDDLQIAIKNNAGNVVQTLDLGPQRAGLQRLVWDGGTDSGAQALDGNYQFELTATSNDQNLPASAITPLAFGQVQNAVLNNGLVKVNVASAGNVALSDIREIV